MKGSDVAKILIVDDEERLLTLYSAILRKEGYEVLATPDARKACDLAGSAQPDLILLDLMMPVDGVDTFGLLAEHPRTKHIPVIFLTSLVQESEVEAGRGKIGGREYISKSTPMPRFVAMVKEALSRAQRKQS